MAIKQNFVLLQFPPSALLTLCSISRALLVTSSLISPPAIDQELVSLIHSIQHSVGKGVNTIAQAGSIAPLEEDYQTSPDVMGHLGLLSTSVAGQCNDPRPAF